MNLKIEILILSIFLIIGIAIFLNKPLETIEILADIAKVLISGYLGYLVKTID